MMPLTALLPKNRPNQKTRCPTRSLLLLTAVALLLVAIPPVAAQSNDTIPSHMQSFEEFPFDPQAFELPLEIEYAWPNDMRLRTLTDADGVRMRADWFRGNASFTPNGDAFSSAEHLTFFQRGCDANYSGVCEMSSIGTPDAPQIMIRAVHDRDGSVVFATRLMAGEGQMDGAGVLTIEVFGTPDTPEDIPLADFTTLTDQVFAYFDVP